MPSRLSKKPSQNLGVDGVCQLPVVRSLSRPPALATSYPDSHVAAEFTICDRLYADSQLLCDLVLDGDVLDVLEICAGDFACVKLLPGGEEIEGACREERVSCDGGRREMDARLRDPMWSARNGGAMLLTMAEWGRARGSSEPR
jgi:hypothetical protein